MIYNFNYNSGLLILIFDMEVIKIQKPTTQKGKLIQAIILSLVLTTFSAIGGKWNLIIYPIIFIMLFLLYYLFQTIDNFIYYDGWILENDSITIMKTNMIMGITTRKIYYSEITGITYYEGGARTPSSLQIVTSNNKYSVLPKEGILKLAATLKYFKNLGLKVALAKFDHEVELYLQGKIDSLPMTNDMKIIES